MTTDERRQFDQICRSLTNITPDDRGIVAIENLRAHAKLMAAMIIGVSVSSREQSLALTHLEETTMWAVKGVVLNGAKDLRQ